jgi:hypothetical protein
MQGHYIGKGHPPKIIQPDKQAFEGVAKSRNSAGCNVRCSHAFVSEQRRLHKHSEQSTEEMRSLNHSHKLFCGHRRVRLAEYPETKRVQYLKMLLREPRFRFDRLEDEISCVYLTMRMGIGTPTASRCSRRSRRG